MERTFCVGIRSNHAVGKQNHRSNLDNRYEYHIQKKRTLSMCPKCRQCCYFSSFEFALKVRVPSRHMAEMIATAWFMYWHWFSLIRRNFCISLHTTGPLLFKLVSYYPGTKTQGWSWIQSLTSSIKISAIFLAKNQDYSIEKKKKKKDPRHGVETYFVSEL